MVSAVLGVVAVFVLTAATGYFVAQEFAYVSADRARLSHAADQGDAPAKRALQVMGRLSFMLSGAQLGITVTGLVVGFIAEPALARLLEPPLTWAGLPEGGVGPIALVTGFAIATVVQMVLGELLPKNLALARAERLARALAPSTLVYLAVAGPLIRLFDMSANRLLRAVGVEPVEELHHGATLEELSDIIGESQKSGHLPADLSQLLEKALTFGDRTADEVMVPRPMVSAVPANATVGDLTAQISLSGHTSYPVYGSGEVDDVVGVAGVRELADDALPRETHVRAVARPALLVPGSLPLHGVIERMRETREEFACVVDEYGGLAGILTFEDIAEELVGEIADENDPGEATPARQPDGAWQVDASMRIDEVQGLTGLTLPDDDAYDTLAGLVMALLSRLPRPGDRLTVELDAEAEGTPAGTVQIEVVTVARRVARQVRLHTHATVAAQDPADVRKR
ncbi:hemolysin family protein [Actinomadura sp. HBU206391]|uniref:hemolysin family protein n=1 Tax=Actinomadura sp. HBU206391 TaxID=2731692 RepID=UPI001650CC11|nr:hemolysin family protein [Actinomadura sp. HBU206391]MBC6462105.1 HlyC/CorC family transporter [Actinomadura sp. HBU206391]